MRSIILFLFIFFSVHGSTALDAEYRPLNLLSDSAVYIDKSGALKADEIYAHPEWFEPIDAPFLSYGYILGQSVWVKFTLENTTDLPIHRTIFIDNLMLDTIELFRQENGRLEHHGTQGLLHRDSFHGLIMFSFPITILPEQQVTYFLRTNSASCATWFKLDLLSESDTLKKDITRQVVLGLFFGAMIALMIYNFFLFFFTKDKIYLAYTLYLFSIISQHQSMTGMLLYWLPLQNQEMVETEAFFGIHYLNLLSFSMVLFTKLFLNTKQYLQLNKIVWIMLTIPIILSIISTEENYLLGEATLFSFITMFVLFFVGIYTKRIGNPNASYYVVGWSISLFGFISLAAHNLNIWNAQYTFEYIFETMILTEAFIFSIALANRLKRLNREKQHLAGQLLIQRENERMNLEKTVYERTSELQKELTNNEILLKELHHRVKNNMQFIMSLYSLKLHGSLDDTLREKLKDIELKIQAMGQIHEMLYKENDLTRIDAEHYFNALINNIKIGYDTSNIMFKFNVQASLSAEQAIFCGLIVNELVINAIKHAFLDGPGVISINLTSRNDQFELLISDNGKGCIKKASHQSFGVLMVETLVMNQLNGTLLKNGENGCHYQILF